MCKMEQIHRDKIRVNIKQLSVIQNLELLYQELISRKVVFPNDVEKIKANKNYLIPSDQAQEFFLLYTKRGPDAFGILINILRKIGQIDEANALVEGLDVSSIRGFEDDTASSGYCGSSEASPPSSSSGSGCGIGSSRPHSASTTLLPQSSPVHMRERSSSTGPATPRGRRIKARRATMESLPPLNIKLQLQESSLYNMGVHDAYPMMSNPRGYMLIINNIHFAGNPNASRTGAEKDTENLRALFEALHFIVISHHNVKKKDLFAPGEGVIDSFLSKFSNQDCCVVAVMSHGGEGYFLTADSEHSFNSNKNRVSIWKDFLPKFNNRHCPKLRHKPKIFIIQSCRGEIRDRGVSRVQTDSKHPLASSSSRTREHDANKSAEYEPEDSESEKEQDRIPSFEDMILCQSTVPGFVSNRDIEKGTWYIESLCRVISTYAHNTELTRMLKKVGLLMRSISSEYGEKQMCSYLDAGFHYELYFNPGLTNDDDQALAEKATDSLLMSGAES